MSVQVLERIKETVNKNARNMTDRKKTRKQQIKRDDNDDDGNGGGNNDNNNDDNFQELYDDSDESEIKGHNKD